MAAELSRWVFVRHAQSTANLGRWFSGHRDVDLTPRGVAQAQAAADALVGHRFARAWSSDLLRARRTAELILAERPDSPGDRPPLQLTADLRERSLGDWTGQPIDDLRASGAADVLLEWDGRPPGGESLSDLAARALPWLAALQAQPIQADRAGGATLIVAHGGLLRVILGLLDGMSLHDLARWRVPNAQPLVRDLAPGVWAALDARWGQAEP